MIRLSGWRREGGRGDGGGGTGLLFVFTNLLADPISKNGMSCMSSDHLAIELVMRLVRNRLSILPINNFGSPEKS